MNLERALTIAATSPTTSTSIITLAWNRVTHTGMRAHLAENAALDTSQLHHAAQDGSARVRAALARRSDLSSELTDQLSCDHSALVRAGLALRPLTDQQIARITSQPDPLVIDSLISNWRIQNLADRGPVTISILKHATRRSDKAASHHILSGLLAELTCDTLCLLDAEPGTLAGHHEDLLSNPRLHQHPHLTRHVLANLDLGPNWTTETRLRAWTNHALEHGYTPDRATSTLLGELPVTESTRTLLDALTGNQTHHPAGAGPAATAPAAAGQAEENPGASTPDLADPAVARAAAGHAVDDATADTIASIHGRHPDIITALAYSTQPDHTWPEQHLTTIATHSIPAAVHAAATIGLDRQTTRTRLTRWALDNDQLTSAAPFLGEGLLGLTPASGLSVDVAAWTSVELVGALQQLAGRHGHHVYDLADTYLPGWTGTLGELVSAIDDAHD